MSPQDLLHAFETHNWMPALLMASLVVRTWLTNKSKFPLTLPVNWQPVVVAAATAFSNAVASAQAGASAESIAMTTLAWAGATGFLDGVLVAVWGNPKNAPVWGRWIVMAFDRIESSGASASGSSGGGSSGTPFRVPAPPTVPATPPSAPTPPPTAAQHRTAAWALSLAVGAWVSLFTGALTNACSPAATGLPAAADIAQYWADQNGCVEDASTREAADACRKTNRLAFCAKFPASENCAVDGGSRE